MTEIRSARFAELDPKTAYLLWKLRVDVFVVEQECPYPELDGRDLEPATVHLWAEDPDAPGEPVACLRILDDGEVARVGRVVTAASHRGRGLAAELIRDAIERIGERPSVLDAQAHLEGWYARFGYAATGPQFLEDGIPHVPMRRG